MSHKVHPKSFRIKRISDWGSRWLSKKEYSKFLEGDFRIREFLEKKLKQTWLDSVEIERFPGKLNVIINTARPGLIIGRGGEGVEDLKKILDKKINEFLKKEERTAIKIEIREIRNPWARANLASQWIAQQIEKRMPHRKVLKQALEKIMADKDVKGAKVEVSGRLGGSEIARNEWLKKGRLPLQTIRANIDYAHNGARCSYGTIGVKVWIYTGEEFE